MRRLYALAVLAATVLVVLAVAGPAAADHPGKGGTKLSATMTGAQEVPGPGDPDGFGTATLRVNVGQGEICYTLTAASIAPATAAHIHRGPAGVAGPVVVPLVPPTDGSSSACADVSRELVKEIKKNPAAFYVNVHNADFPAGAIRGQLEKG